MGRGVAVIVAIWGRRWQISHMAHFWQFSGLRHRNAVPMTPRMMFNGFAFLVMVLVLVDVLLDAHAVVLYLEVLYAEFPEGRYPFQHIEFIFRDKFDIFDHHVRLVAHQNVNLSQENFLTNVQGLFEAIEALLHLVPQLQRTRKRKFS